MTDKYPTETALISGLLDRDETAYRQAVRTYHGAMRYLAASFVGEKLADEVVQEAWLSVLTALDKFERRSSLKTWILRIVSNEAKTRLRKENRLVSLEALLGEDSDMASRFDASGHWSLYPTDWQAHSPEDLLSTSELKACIELLTRGLPGIQVATLAMREQQGLSYEEICNILDISESNVRVLVHRARNRLYECIEHFRNTGECLAEQR